MVLPILRALGAAVRRNLSSYGALKTNNFFLFVVLLVWGNVVAGVPPQSAYPFLIVLGLLMLFPVSSDPLDQIPPVRLTLWPLSHSQRLALRMASLAYSPVLWLTFLMLALGGTIALAALFLGASICIQMVGVLAARMPAVNIARLVPRFPGRLGGLIGANLRETITLLDPYLAFVIAAGGTSWRVFGHADPGALPILAMLTAVAMSTLAQCLFAFESGAGMTRLRLMPLRGWEIILAKDVAFLGAVLVLTLPMDAMAGMTFGFAALAIGRHPTMKSRIAKPRWRFSSGHVLWGVLQGVVGAALGFHAAGGGLAVAILLYAISLSWAGRVWEAQGDETR